MDVKEIYKKGMEAVKRGQDISKVLKPEEIKAFATEQIKHKVVVAVMPFVIKVILACLIIGVLLAVFMYIFEFFAGLFGKFAEGWGYLWSGTSSLVTKKQVYTTYKELVTQGIDFEEIGAVGERYFEKENISDRTPFMWTTYKDIPEDQITLQNRVNKDTAIATDVNATSTTTLETFEEARKRLWISKLIPITTNGSDQEIGGPLYFYLRKYLEAQMETFSARNNFTFAGDSGSIFVYGDRNLWQWYTDSSQAVVIDGDQFYIEAKYTGDGNSEAEDGDGTSVTLDDGTSGTEQYQYENKDGLLNITGYVNKFAMPWQYPFAFHKATLSPDVGYDVAQLAFDYHYLKLKAVKLKEYKTWETKNDGSGTSSPTDTVKWFTTKYTYTTKIYPEEIATWYETEEYKYNDQTSGYYGIINEISEPYISGGYKYTDVLGNETFTTQWRIDYKYVTDETVTRRPTNYGNNPDDTGDPTGFEAMEKILLPMPEKDPNDPNLMLPGVEYYKANLLEQKESLGIKSSSHEILKSLHDLYESKTSTVPGDKSVTYRPDGEEALREEIKTNSYLLSQHKPVVDLIQFFLTTGVIDASEIIGALNVNKFITTLRWPLDETTISTVTYNVDQTIATLNATAGTTVIAPANGTISIENGVVKIDTPEYTIFLTNVNPIVTSGSISAGATLGTVSGSSGITYQRMDKTTSEMVVVAEEINFIKNVAQSDYMWPVPGFTSITSPFGWRTHPVTGEYKHHDGIDISGGGILGAQIVSLADGEVTKTGFERYGGNHIYVTHANGVVSKYVHLYVIGVTEGQQVKKGEVIGLVGNTGEWTTGAHLHFEISSNGTDVDPLSYLSLYTN